MSSWRGRGRPSPWRRLHKLSAPRSRHGSECAAALQSVLAHLVVDFFGGCLVRLRLFPGAATAGFGTRVQSSISHFRSPAMDRSSGWPPWLGCTASRARPAGSHVVAGERRIRVSRRDSTRPIFLRCVASTRHDARALHLLVQVASRRGGVLRRPPPISAPTALLDESHRRSSGTIRAVRRACAGDHTQRRGVATVPMMNNSHGRPAAAVWSIRRLLGRLAIGCRLLAI